MAFSNLLDELAEQVDNYVRTEMVGVSASELGLDNRCGLLYVDDDAIAVRAGCEGRLNYYGGFEYIESEYVTKIGNWVFYSREHDRVEDALSYRECNSENSEEEC